MKILIADCGKTYIGYNDPSEAVNGSFMSIHSWPWHVDVLYKGKSACSGILIDRYWILTVAACLGYFDDI